MRVFCKLSKQEFLPQIVVRQYGFGQSTYHTWKSRYAGRAQQSLAVPKRFNQTWSLDYMSDALADERRFRTANSIDDCNREGLGILAYSDYCQEKLLSGLIILPYGGAIPLLFESTMDQKISLVIFKPGKPAQQALNNRTPNHYTQTLTS